MTNENVYSPHNGDNSYSSVTFTFYKVV